MIIFKDLITGDEILSDSYPIKEVGGVLLEAEGAMITIGGETFNTGANASAEEADEGLEDSKQQVINIKHSFNLTETQFDKKSYMTHIKGYMKGVKKALEDNGAPAEDIAAFEKGAQAQAKRILGSFKDYEFLIGESMNPDGMVILLNYREDGVTPFVTVWKHGLKQEKV